METGVSMGGFVLLALSLAAAGLLTGFMAGLLGVGGGGIVVPVLYEVFRAVGVDEAIRMHLSVGTSLAVIIPTSLRSFTAHRAMGAVDDALVRRLALPIVLGVIAGVVLARHAPPAALKLIWVVSGTIVAAKLYAGRDDWRLGNEIPKSKLVEAYGVFVGVVSTLMSIGGAAFITSMMTLYGRPMLQAVATASGGGPLIAIPGAIGFVWAGWGNPMLPPGSLGYVSVLGALLIIPTSVYAAPFGVRAAHGVSRRTLELAFATFLTVVAIRFLVSL